MKKENKLIKCDKCGVFNKDNSQHKKYCIGIEGVNKIKELLESGITKRQLLKQGFPQRVLCETLILVAHFGVKPN